ncbi:MAG: FAD-dependent oxidoreductase [Patescibacteria group bacterium]
MTYDVIIVGSGPAGLTAALYSSRRALKTLVLGKELGGQAILPACVDNFPGVAKTDGVTLVNNWKTQVVEAGAELRYETVVGIERTEKLFKVKMVSGQEETATAIILALGRTPRKLNVPGEAEFTSKGVAYCATCDAPLFSGKAVAVIGGGNAAVDAALLLAGIASKVYLIHRNRAFKAEAALLDKLKISPVEIKLDTIVEEIKGEKVVTGIKIKQAANNQSEELSVQGVFVEIGGDANTQAVIGLVKLNNQQEIVIDELNRTSIPGIFAAGDATTVPFKQMVIAAGEGAKSALSAYNYIQTQGR